MPWSTLKTASRLLARICAVSSLPASLTTMNRGVSTRRRFGLVDSLLRDARVAVEHLSALVLRQVREPRPTRARILEHRREQVRGVVRTALLPGVAELSAPAHGRLDRDAVLARRSEAPLEQCLGGDLAQKLIEVARRHDFENGHLGDLAPRVDRELDAHFGLEAGAGEIDRVGEHHLSQRAGRHIGRGFSRERQRRGDEQQETD